MDQSLFKNDIFVLIDYNNGNCLKQALMDGIVICSCNPRYTDCHATDMLIISILSLIVLTCRYILFEVAP